MSDAPFARAKEIARRVNPDESWGQLSANEQATYLGFAIAERDAARLRATLDEVRDVWNNMASGELGHNAALVALGEALDGDTND